MRFGAALVPCFITLVVACGDASSPADSPGETAGSGGAAGAAGEAGAAGDSGDAAPEGAAGQSDDAGVGGAETGADADTCDDAGSLEAPPLTADEAALILEADDTTPMEIVTNTAPADDEFLHQVALPIDPGDPTVQHLIARMRVTLAAAPGGVGLAAPQVRVSRRLFLAARTDQPGQPVQPFLNPVITEYSPETAAGTEGCLSVPVATPSVTRSLWVTVTYGTEDGGWVCGETIGSTTNASVAYAARIVQHEYDHLDGILIVDK